MVQFFNSFQINILSCIFKQKPLEVTKGNMESQRKKRTTDINKTSTMFARLGPRLFSIFDNPKWPVLSKPFESLGELC